MHQIAAMANREERYLRHFPEKHRHEVAERHQAPETSSQAVAGELQEFALDRGLDLTRVPESLRGRPFDPDELKTAARELAQHLFNNPQACLDPAKCAAVEAEAEVFVDLLDEAREAGALGNFQADDAYRLVSTNLVGLAWQDRAAAETLMGDHGVRHLVGHNIKVCDQLADGLALGPEVRLILHQAMLWHDVGYAVRPVRDSLNQEGIRGQDAGHNVLAGRLVRERAGDPADPLARIFTPEQLDLIHRCVLYHDKDAEGQAGINLANPDNQAALVESVVRLADNSHAFEDKLPQALYEHPEAFQTMKLLTSAAELGLADEGERLTARLRAQVQGGLGRDNREAMEIASRHLEPGAVPFAVARVGANPGVFQVNGPGQVLVAFEENLAHEELVQLYGQQPLGQLNRAVRDLTGQSLAENSSVEIPGLTVRLQGRATTETPFQEKLREALHDPAFRAWALAEVADSRQEAALRASLTHWDQLSERERALQGEIFGEQTPDEIRHRRIARLRACLKELEA